MSWFLRSKWINPSGKLIKGNELSSKQKLKYWLHTYPNKIFSKVWLNSMPSVDKWGHKCAKLYFYFYFPSGNRVGGWAGLGLGFYRGQQAPLATPPHTPSHFFNFHCQGNEHHSQPLLFLAKNRNQEKYVRKFKISNLWFYFTLIINVGYKNLNFWGSGKWLSS